MSAETNVPVMDYEGSNYRSDFWVNANRSYEDAAERLALTQLLPLSGGRIAEIGAGFGRLADLYLQYDQILLFDYSRTLLQEAVETWGHDERFVFVAGNIYQLPLADGILDSLVMVRVMHHLADVPAALAQLSQALHSQSVAVMEYANKRNLKAVLRWLMRRQEWSPVDREPVEFVPLNFDFHPEWMKEHFQSTGMQSESRLAVSHFRQPLLKRIIAPHTLAQFDSALFAAGGYFPVAPSVFERLTLPGASGLPGRGGVLQAEELFQCPACKVQQWHVQSNGTLQCQKCDDVYVQKNKIWDFKK